MANDTQKKIAKIFSEVADAIETGEFGDKPKIALTLPGSEHGSQELVRGAELALEKYANIEVVLLGSDVETDFELIECKTLSDAHDCMDELLEKGEVDGAVTHHYSFPIGVSTVGKVVTPGAGKEMILATTTGTSDSERVASMLKNAVYGQAVARALGVENPSLGILNIEGARLVEQKLLQLDKNGYNINFAESARKDGGSVMRGNDLLLGTPDIMVTDTLTGNMLMKMFSAFTTGGRYEASGYGYGPGIGEDYDRIIMILSRASGAPVAAKAIEYAAQVASGKVNQIAKEEFSSAYKAGLDSVVETKKEVVSEDVKMPPKKNVTEEIPGIEILDLDDAAKAVWKAGIYAETGMGCTGPVILVAPEDHETAYETLKKAGFVS